ncbi:MAG: hypothetical protein ABIW76_06185 [Fibrobacteria bacterium]
MGSGINGRQKTRNILTAAILACQALSFSAVGNLHPHFTIKHILPAEMNNIAGIGGIDLLPNGDGAICTWGGSQKTVGEVWIVPGLASGTPGTPTRIATGLREPLGVKAVGADFYVMEKPHITKFSGSGTTWTKTKLWSLPTAWYTDSQWHHFSFNLVLRDNAFWFTTGTAYDYDPKDPIQRGALIKVPLDGGSFTQLARGLRNTNGIGLGPDNEFFAPENQGHWKPVNALYHITTANVPANGRFYGFRTEGNNSCGVTPPNVAGTSCPADPEYPPAIWMPYGGFSTSPTRPILLKAGPYAGQMIGGDVNHGGTFRYFLEKVNGEYQGAAFGMMTAGSGGINFGINQFLYTPGGSLLVAGIGGGVVCGTEGSGNWNWNSTCRGLDLLTPTDKAAFEPLAIRSVPGGFDVEFTQPANAAAGNKANWQVRTTVITPAQVYGSDGNLTDNNISVGVTSATLSADAKHVFLELASLLPKRMYAITMNNVTSATGEAAYTNVGYYTLNSVSTTTALRPDGFPDSRPEVRLRATVQSGQVSLDIPYKAYRIGLFRVDGSRVAEAASGMRLEGPGRLVTGRLSPGVYLLTGTADDGLVRQRVRVE